MEQRASEISQPTEDVHVSSNASSASAPQRYVSMTDESTEKLVSESLLQLQRALHDSVASERPGWEQVSTIIQSEPEAFAQKAAPLPAPVRRRLLRDLLTVHSVALPLELVEKIEAVVRRENEQRPIHDALSLPRIAPKVAVWRGDITTLRIDAIVNAANAQMLGCFTPGHTCIDNVIHDRAGPLLRQECRVLMQEQGHEEATGACKVTSAYCLPCRSVLHTVGPIIEDELRPDDLASCYRSCLSAATAAKLRSVAFCCISTGVFCYPQEEAAHVALSTVRDWLAVPAQADRVDLVLLNVFTAKDDEIYRRLAPSYFPAITP